MCGRPVLAVLAATITTTWCYYRHHLPPFRGHMSSTTTAAFLPLTQVRRRGHSTVAGLDAGKRESLKERERGGEISSVEAAAQDGGIT